MSDSGRKRTVENRRKIMNNNSIISRVSALAAASLMLFSFASCGEIIGTGKVSAPGIAVSSGDDSSKSDPASGETTASETEAPPETDPPENGFATDADGNKRYYLDGELQKDGIVGNEQDGFYYADADGLINTKYCDGLNIDGNDWCVIEGKATRVFSEEDKTLFAACKAIGKCTNSNMSREEKLRASFNYIKTAYLEGVPHNPPYREMDWPVVCANDLFINGKGDCYSYGAAYAYYAKAIGYEEVYACNSGGHGWTEVEDKFYDPEWDMHHQEYNHFGVAPDDECDVNYTRGLAPGEAWMRIKV